MAKPIKPKDIKPKTDGEAPAASAGAAAPSGGGGLDLKFIITIAVVLLSNIICSGAAVYFLAPMVLVPAISAQLPKAEGEAAKPKKVEGPKLGLNLELDEFTANLKLDPNKPGNQFIRVKMTLSVAVPKEEDCNLETKPGGGGEGGGNPCEKAFNGHMAPFVPTIRDIVNAALMRRTADDISTPEGQEALKDDIRTQINGILGEKYKILRVNFQDFVVQR
jgi:flagellar basal body-associated protein FliL